MGIKVVFGEFFFTATRHFASFPIRFVIKVNGDGMDMVDRADKYVESVLLQQILNESTGGRPNPICFHTDEDLDPRRVRSLQSISLLNIVIEQLLQFSLRTSFSDLELSVSTRDVQQRSYNIPPQGRDHRPLEAYVLLARKLPFSSQWHS